MKSVIMLRTRSCDIGPLGPMVVGEDEVGGGVLDGSEIVQVAGKLKQIKSYLKFHRKRRCCFFNIRLIFMKEMRCGR